MRPAFPRTKGASNAGGFASSARRQAKEILSGSQYQSRPQRSIHPFSGVLNAVGRWLERTFDPVGRWIESHVLHPSADGLAGALGPWWPYVVLGILIVAGAIAGAVVIRRRAKPGRESGVVSAEPGQRADADELEKLARKAELGGDLDTAVRLSYRAGITRLEELGIVRFGLTRTDRQLSETLGSRTFDTLAADFESIAYGGARASAKQAADAREGWRLVASEAERSRADAAGRADAA